MNSSSVFPPDHGKIPPAVEMNFGPQPGPVTVIVTGNPDDLNKWFPKLYSWLHNQSANVDFEKDGSGLKFKVYPFAVND